MPTMPCPQCPHYAPRHPPQHTHQEHRSVGAAFERCLAKMEKESRERPHLVDKRMVVGDCFVCVRYARTYILHLIHTKTPSDPDFWNIATVESQVGMDITRARARGNKTEEKTV